MAKLNVKKSKLFWLLMICGILLMILGVFLAPFWAKIWAECPWKSWGISIVSIVMAICIILYLAGYLFKKMLKSRGTIQILTIIEFILLALIALGLIFSQFNILNIPDQPGVILGIAIYCRGVIEIFRAYYYQRDNKVKYPVWWLVVAILFVTLGVLLMCGRLFNITKEMIAWVIALCVFVLGIVGLVYGILAKPASKKDKSKKIEKKKEASDK